MLGDFLKFVSPAPRDNNDKSRPEKWVAKPPAFSTPRGYYGERLGQQVTWWILAISPASSKARHNKNDRRWTPAPINYGSRKDVGEESPPRNKVGCILCVCVCLRGNFGSCTCWCVGVYNHGKSSRRQKAREKLQRQSRDT